MPIPLRCNLVLILYLIKMKKIVFLCMFMSIVSFAQNSINNYKYVIVPEKFDFLKQPDKYQTSSLTKFLLKKEGFVVFLDSDNLPLELKQNRCLSLIATIKDASKTFKTNSFLELKDCNNKILFTSRIGSSRLKDYKKAYHEAIRGAFKSLTAIKYRFQPIQNRNNKIVRQDNRVAQPVVRRDEVSRRNTTNNTNRNEIDGNNNNKRIPVLQAKLIKDGYQLINVKGTVVFDVLYTKLDKVFVIKNKNGVFYKGNNNNWIAEFYDQQGNKVSRNFLLDVSLR